MENKIITGGDKAKETSELKKEIYELLGKADSGYKEVRKIDEICERLDELEPVNIDFSKESEWKKFDEAYGATSNKKHRITKRRYKIKPLLISVIIIVFANILSTVFVGANMLSAIHIFTDEALIIRSEEANLMKKDNSSFKPFRTIEELENEKNIKLMLPTYLPDDYELEYISASEEGISIIIAFSSISNNDSIRLIVNNIEEYGSNGEFIVEKDSSEVETFVSRNKEYNIFSNNSDTVIEWLDGDYVYILEGNIQYKQVRKIIKNIK